MKEFLQGISLFEDFTDEEFEEIANIIEIRNVKASETIIRQEEPVGTLFLIKSGTAKVVLIDERGEEEVLAIVQAGEVLGELCLIDDLPPSATVVAEDDLVLYAISNEEMRALMKRDLSLGNKILWALNKTLVQRLRDTDQSLSFARLLVKFSRG